MKPYFEEDGITIYCGDCREILPQLPNCDLVVTDPPYPGLKGGLEVRNDNLGKVHRPTYTVGTPWGEDIGPLATAWDKCSFGMLVFCSFHCVGTVLGVIPVKPYALVSWYKRNSMPPVNNVPCYETEFIWAFKKAPGLNWRALRGMYDIPMPQAGCMARERFVNGGAAVHPSQKPISLLSALLRIGGESVLDPYMGTGTTLEAAKMSNIRAIGIEIEEKYCEIAAKRLSQGVLPLEAA